jgi:hypothetical protein
MSRSWRYVVNRSTLRHHNMALCRKALIAHASLVYFYFSDVIFGFMSCLVTSLILCPNDYIFLLLLPSYLFFLDTNYFYCRLSSD